jgi:hypothetical protein
MIFTVLCTNKDIDKGVYDGFQLRDLRHLDPKKRYFPPFSIPYVGPTANTNAPVDFVNRVTGWSSLGSKVHPDGDAPWISFWSRNFARAIGEAKAALHLCYGLQGLTPNSQNFLLEFDQTMAPTGKVVVRDVLDMKLHSDWVYTVLGPSLERKSLVRFFDRFMDSRLYQILKYEIDSVSRITPGDNTRRMVQDSETFADVMKPRTT